MATRCTKHGTSTGNTSRAGGGTKPRTAGNTGRIVAGTKPAGTSRGNTGRISSESIYNSLVSNTITEKLRSSEYKFNATEVGSYRESAFISAGNSSSATRTSKTQIITFKETGRQSKTLFALSPLT